MLYIAPAGYAFCFFFTVRTSDIAIQYKFLLRGLVNKTMPYWINNK